MHKKDTNIMTLPTRNQQNQPLTMMERESDAYRSATRIGITAGLRSMTPLALLAWTSEQEHNIPLAATQEHRPSTLQAITGLAAVGEIIADKLPTIPSRLESRFFVGRMIIGAVAGAIICRRAGQPLIQGAMRGAIGASIGTIVGYTYRTLVAQTTSIPDVVLATIEDIVALNIGWQAVHSSQQVKRQKR